MTAARKLKLDQVFFALSDPTRRSIVRQLAKGEATVGQLSAPFGLAPATISKHLRVLEAAQLVSRRVEGRRHVFELAPTPMRQAQRWLQRHLTFWEGSLDQLEGVLEELRTLNAKGTRNE